MHSDEQIYTYRVTRKVRTGGSRGGSLVLGIVGIICFLFVNWIIGAVLVVVACLVDAKYGYISSCGHCGNEVAHTSSLCPTCHADLAPEPRKGWLR